MGMPGKTGSMVQKAGSSAILAKISLDGEKAAGNGKKFRKYLKQCLVKTIQTPIPMLTRGYRKATPSQEETTHQATTTMTTEVTTSTGGGSRSVMTTTVELHKGDGSPNVITRKTTVLTMAA